MWMILSSASSANFIRITNIYSPLWVLSLIFILGGLTNIVLKLKYFWLYVLLVSTPLIFLGFVFLQVAITADVFSSNVILCNFVGVYSAIRAGQIFKRRKSFPLEIKK